MHCHSAHFIEIYGDASVDSDETATELKGNGSASPVLFLFLEMYGSGLAQDKGVGKKAGLISQLLTGSPPEDHSLAINLYKRLLNSPPKCDFTSKRAIFGVCKGGNVHRSHF